MRSIEYVDWDEVRQVCDRLVRANEGLHAVDSVNFRVGRLRAQLVPDRRSMRLLTDASGRASPAHCCHGRGAQPPPHSLSCGRVQHYREPEQATA